MRIKYSRPVIACLSLIACAFPAQKQKESVAPAPVPSQLLSSQTAFISYAGINSQFIESYISDHTGSPNGFYDEFYAAMKTWGKYRLVSSPADADLVLQISLIREAPSIEDPYFELRILDPKTHAILWSFLEKVPAGSGRPASRRAAWEKALGKLTNDLKAIVTPATE